MAKVLVYNRVHKAGSSLMDHVLFSLATRNNFTVVADNNYFREDMPAAIAALPDEAVYISHNHYYADVGRPAVWMNMVREPIDREQSIFYYRVDPKLEREAAYEALEARRRRGACGCAGMEFTECIVLRKNLSCVDVVDRQTNYFCQFGESSCSSHDDSCVCNKDLALKRAFHEYAVVGILEEFALTLRLFETILPRWFEGASEVFASMHNDKFRSTTIANDLTPGTHLNGCVSSEARAILKTAPGYATEAGFYKAVKEYFWLRVVKEGIITQP